MRGLLVDYGGVLTTNVFDAFRAFAASEGLEPDAVKDLFRSDPDALALSARARDRAPDHEEFSERFAPLLGVQPEGLVGRLFAGMGPDEAMVAAVRRAREQGVRTGLVSNSWGAGLPYDRDALVELFDAAVISGEVGLHKPAPEIFRLAAERIEVESPSAASSSTTCGELRGRRGRGDDRDPAPRRRPHPTAPRGAPRARRSARSRRGVTSRWRAPWARGSVGHAAAEAAEVGARAALRRDRRHPHALQAAGHDPLERLQVVVDVDREAVGRDPLLDVDADRGDLALPHPHAGVVGALLGARARLDALLGERRDDRLLHRAQVGDDVADAHDRVADELAGAVVGDAAAAVDVDDVDALAAVPGLAHRQLAGRRAPPARVDRRVLEQQQRVGDRVGLAGARAARSWSASASRYSTVPRWQTQTRCARPWVKVLLEVGASYPARMDRVGLRRLRWRMRGAWLGPAFVAGSVAGGVLLDRLPVAGDGIGLVAGILLAGFLNLAAVILLGSLGGMLLRRRSGDLPREIARDRAGIAAIGVVCAVLAAAGLVHRPDVLEQERDFTAQSMAARDYLAHRAPPDVRANAVFADSIRIDRDLYRTCAPRRDGPPRLLPLRQHRPGSAGREGRHQRRAQRGVRRPSDGAGKLRAAPGEPGPGVAVG